MKPARWLLALSLVTPALHAAGDDELQRLKDENARLKAQIESLKQQQAAQPGSTTGAAPAAAGSPASANARTPNAAGASGMQSYDGIDLSQTGCSTGTAAAWKEQVNWDALRRSMSTTEVEQWLGKAHFNVQTRDRLMWQYGKCGNNVQGYAVFEGGSLVYWKTPDF